MASGRKFCLSEDGNLYLNGVLVIIWNTIWKVCGEQFNANLLCVNDPDGNKKLLDQPDLEYLYKNSELFPEKFKKDSEGESIRIYLYDESSSSPGSVSFQVMYWNNDSES